MQLIPEGLAYWKFSSRDFASFLKCAAILNVSIVLPELCHWVFETAGKQKFRMSNYSRFQELSLVYFLVTEDYSFIGPTSLPNELFVDRVVRAQNSIVPVMRSFSPEDPEQSFLDAMNSGPHDMLLFENCLSPHFAGGDEEANNPSIEKSSLVLSLLLSLNFTVFRRLGPSILLRRTRNG